MLTDLPTVLVVDDKPNMVRLMSKVLRADAQVLTATGGQEALRLLASHSVQVILSDLKMPDMSGLELLEESKRLQPQAEFVLMTAYATVRTAVEALRLGVYDYLTKPFDPDDARAVILRALGRAGPGPARDQDLIEVFPKTFARSARMRDLGTLVQRVANSAATALIIGETGTGKERIARAIHELSPRANRRLVAVNCAAIPAELLESELFGYRKGAFTGAERDRAGLFEEADGGTLFLDEIGEMRLSLQAKLTRALEERAVRRVGDNRERSLDVRIVAATHRDLEAMARAGTFREDLWYRLNVAVLEVPPLRDRAEDIEALAVTFLRDVAGTIVGRRIAGFTPGALSALKAYEWPGNVRQLRAAVERACVVAQEDRIDAGDLPREVLTGRTGHAPAELADKTWAVAMEDGRHELGRIYLEAVLERHHGSVTGAANQAGVERESFYRLLRRHGVDARRFRRG